VIGRTINNYEIRTLLAEGGMGAVYLAEHPVLERRTAIKVLRGSLAGNESMVSRFMNEARAANALKHPNIVDIIDAGRLPGGLPYLMMEYLEGESLATRLQREGRLSIAEAVEIVREVAAGLGAAHDKGIVHCDLKPDNLFLALDPTSWRGVRTKILDFGVAKLHPDLTGGADQVGGPCLGTPSYMAPEQCRADGPDVDRRADIYAMGTVLYHMLCGSPPFAGQDRRDVFVKHVSQPPVPPRQFNPDVSPAIEAVILRALEKHPRDRFASMAELRDALAPGGSPTPTSVLPRVPMPRRRWLALVGLGSTAVLAGALFWPARRPDVARRPGPRRPSPPGGAPVATLAPPVVDVASARSDGEAPAVVATPTPAPAEPVAATVPPRRRRGPRRRGAATRTQAQNRRARRWAEK
jgi:serine/threonine protein kinase